MRSSQDQAKRPAENRRSASIGRMSDSDFIEAYRTSLLTAIEIAGIVAMRALARERSHADAAPVCASMKAHHANLVEIAWVCWGLADHQGFSQGRGLLRDAAKRENL